MVKKMILFCGFVSTVILSAQDAQPKVSGSFFQVILDSGVIGILIWLMLFMCSVFTLWGIVDAMLKVRIEKICPQYVQTLLMDAIRKGNVGEIISVCNKERSSFSDIVKQIFMKTEKGFSSMEETAAAAIQNTEENMMHRLNYLNLWGAIAPMLGLLGTVTGMVDAFFTLGNSTGVEKAQMLAMAISQALYTTAAGLFISIPAIVAYNIFKNKAVSAITRTERAIEEILDEVRDRV